MDTDIRSAHNRFLLLQKTVFSGFFTLKFIILLCAYVLLGVVGLALEPVSEFATLVWPAAGVALAFLLLYGYRFWPAITAGALIVNMLQGASPLVALAIALGNTLEAVSATVLLRKSGINTNLSRRGDILRFIAFAALLSPMIAATIGTTSLLSSGFVAPLTYGATWVAWWVGDMLGVLIVTPFLLVWLTRNAERFTRIRAVEISALTALIIAMSFLIFTVDPDQQPVMYLLFLPAIWLTLRFGRRGATAGVLGFSLIALASTLIGFGPFVRSTLVESLFWLQFFMAALSTSTLLLAAVSSERTRAEVELHQSQEALVDFFNNAPVSLCGFAMDGTILWANRFQLELLGYTSSEYVGHTIREFHAVEKTAEDMLRRIRMGESIVSYEAQMRAKDGFLRQVLLNINVLRRRNTNIYARCYMVDMTERKRLEERRSLVADSSKVLFTPRHLDERLRNFSQLVISRIADWCAIYILDDDGIRMHTVMHQDGEKRRLAREIIRQYPIKGESGVARVIKTGKSELYSIVTEEQLARGQWDQTHLAMLRGIGFTSGIIVPLIGRGKTLGAMVFAYADAGKQYTTEDLFVAEDMAQRAAVAVDNALLHEKIVRADRAKDEFLAKLSHELRNPFAAIVNTVELLVSKVSADPNESELLKGMERQVSKMSRLLDDILDMSLIAYGQVSFRQRKINVETVILRAVETIRNVIDVRQHKLMLSLPLFPIWLTTDPLRLEQIIINLLTNSAKYTNPGGTISLACSQDGSDVVLRIKDNGFGIRKDMLSKIFDPFIRPVTHGSHIIKGLGIGLNLVKTFVEMQGGSIEARSDGEGLGSEFIVRLPLARKSSPIEDTQSDGREEAALSLIESASRPLEETRPLIQTPAQIPLQAKHKILLVDDNHDVAAILRALLVRAGYEVATAHDGKEAIASFRSYKPNVVILDIGLPGMDGYEVARVLRSEGRDPFILVALTGYGQKKDKVHSEKAGFNYHLTKPVSLATLQRIINDAFVSSVL